MEILDRVKSVEHKIDNLSIGGSTTPTVYASQPTSVYPAGTPLLIDHEAQEPHQASSGPSTSPAPMKNGGYRYDSSVSRVLEWPAVRQLLESVGHKPQVTPSELDLSALPHGIRGSTVSLPTDGVQSMGISNNNVLQVPLQFPSSSRGLDLNPPSIDWETMQRLTKGYFDAFNFLHPIMDRQWFSSNVLTSILNNGFQENTTSTLVLLVFALGEVAYTASEVPVSAFKGRPSGIKGGTIDRPPGITYFNEARKRMGFSLTEVSVENVQMFALAALYNQSCGQALECWRMSVLASVACQALISRLSGELHDPRADLIRRVFWHCLMMETSLHLEFGLPSTGLGKLDDTVGLPNFNGPITEEDYIGNQTTHFQEHFAAQIVLRSLSATIHTTLTHSFGNSSAYPVLGLQPSNSPPGGANSSIMKQLATRLDQWRSMLPGHLRWHEDQMAAYADPSQNIFTSIFAGNSQTLQGTYMFPSDLSHPSARYSYSGEIQVALLRTRYYYNKYLVYRPCVFKALHHPDALTQEDANGAAECLKASLKWPIALSPPCANKRLVPIAFFWSQNFLGILILLQLSQQHPMLRRIRSSLCGRQFDEDATETASLYLDWLRDMKKIDSTADWCWAVIRLIYHLDD